MKEGKMCQLLQQWRQTVIRTQLLPCQVQWLLPTEEMVCSQHIFEVRKLSKSNSMRISVFTSIFTCQGSQASPKLSRNKVFYPPYHSTAGREYETTRWDLGAWLSCQNTEWVENLRQLWQEKTWGFYGFKQLFSSTVPLNAFSLLRLLHKKLGWVKRRDEGRGIYVLFGLC